jgi:hypothetical protein
MQNKYPNFKENADDDDLNQIQIDFRKEGEEEKEGWNEEKEGWNEEKEGWNEEEKEEDPDMKAAEKLKPLMTKLRERLLSRADII